MNKNNICIALHWTTHSLLQNDRIGILFERKECFFCKCDLSTDFAVFTSNDVLLFNICYAFAAKSFVLI